METMTFTAKDVMTLRQKTGLGMMDCKQALAASNGDMEAAEQWLRVKLKGKMDKRTERAAGEGRIGIAVAGDGAAIIELRTETDFTSRNESFVNLVDDVAKAALSLPAGAVEPTESMKKGIDDVRMTTGENLSFARGERLQGGRFGRYVHHDGKRAALIQIEGEADEALLTGICQHIVAHVPPPVGISGDDVASETIDRIRADAVAEAQESGKPAEIAQKMAEGRVRKFLEENTLLNQKFVRDDSKTIKDLLPAGVTVKRFIRYTVGAG
jgi:elongation factor Ts